MRKERKILRFVPQKLRKSFANGNPTKNLRSSTSIKIVASKHLPAYTDYVKNLTMTENVCKKRAKHDRFWLLQKFEVCQKKEIKKPQNELRYITSL